MDLTCPLCALPLANPTTLHCGHSLCSAHLDAPTSSCPVPECSTAHSSLNIPADSPVKFTPAPTPNIPITPHRSDVVLNKVIALLHPKPPPEPDSDEDSDPRPRKRVKHTHQHDSDNDLLSHLRTVAAHERETPSHIPLSDPDDEFDKKLLEELTCHICYVLFYQPVTTPCQHVRIFLPFLTPIQA